jgi:hypothetical protein
VKHKLPLGIIAVVFAFVCGSSYAQTQTLTGNPDATVNLGNSSTSTFKVFNSANTELLRVAANGNVTIGAQLGNEKLVVNGSIGIPVNNKLMFNSGGSVYSMRLNPNSALTFETNGIDQMGITSAGNVGIGTLTPADRLSVVGTIKSTGAITSDSVIGVLYGQKFMLNSAGTPFSIHMDNYTHMAFETNNADRVFITPTGQVGVNARPSATGTILQLQSPSSTSLVRFRDLVSQGIPNGVSLDMPGNGQIELAGIRIGGLGLSNIDTFSYDSNPASSLRLNATSNTDVIVGDAAYTTKGLKVLSSGLSTFGGTVNIAGDIVLGGTINAKYQDVAEWVPATVPMTAGTVVVLNPEHNNEVMPSAIAYDTTVAGVVSERPGVILGVESSAKAQIATTGRVKVHVRAGTRGVKIGDLLVTSDEAGVAMVSEPVDLGGIKLHRPGTLIGKALEPLRSGEGDVLVLLALQ